jgi:MerR family transcriptional regulator, thiopeptide resistance regulator
MQRPVTIGALAKATGVSVRALRHYDHLGLLQPAARSEANYRLYDADDIARLQKIRSLQALGFTLQQIGQLLDDRTVDLETVLAWHLTALDDHAAQLDRLREQLRGVLIRLRQQEETNAQALLSILEEMSDMEKYYSKEQLETLARRREALGEEGMRAAEAQWASLIDRVRDAEAAGIDPAEESVQAMAREWQSLIDAFTGGDPGIRESLQRVWEDQDRVAGYDVSEMQQLGTYLSLAMGNDPAK